MNPTYRIISSDVGSYQNTLYLTQEHRVRAQFDLSDHFAIKVHGAIAKNGGVLAFLKDQSRISNLFRIIYRRNIPSITNSIQDVFVYGRQTKPKTLLCSNVVKAMTGPIPIIDA